MPRTLLSTFTLCLLTVLVSASSAAAEPACRQIHGRFTLELLDANACESAIDLCAQVRWQGSIQATSLFAGSSQATTEDTGATGVVLVTGDNTIHTRFGTLVTKDAIVLAVTGNGEFAEVDTIVSGTGAFADATGRITATGTLVEGAGQGRYVGEICWP